MNIFLDNKILFNVSEKSLPKIQTIWPVRTELDQGFQLLFYDTENVKYTSATAQYLKIKMSIYIAVAVCSSIIVFLIAMLMIFYRRYKRISDDFHVELPKILIGQDMAEVFYINLGK